MDSNGKLLFALLKLPAVETGTVPEVDAGMLQQLAWFFRLGMRLEILGRTYDRGALVGRDTNSDHVFVYVLPEMDPSVEAISNDVSLTVIRGHVEHYIRVLAVEHAQFRRKDWYGKARDKKAYPATRPCALSCDVLQGLRYLDQGGLQSSNELRPGLRECYAPRRSRKQAYAKLLLQRPHSVTYC